MATSRVFHAQLLSPWEDPRSQLTVWLSSVLLGILACKTIYNAMKAVSPFVPHYSKLSKAEKVEWDNRYMSLFVQSSRTEVNININFKEITSHIIWLISEIFRGFSTAHSIAISAAALYFVFISNLYKDDAPYGPVVFRSSLSSQITLGVSYY
ncbi:hypothetical protein L7F22_032403 [Adiantum nelumboides]|nr:hypothetical protein [Adiantum nelumboides]